MTPQHRPTSKVNNENQPVVIEFEKRSEKKMGAGSRKSHISRGACVREPSVWFTFDTATYATFAMLNSAVRSSFHPLAVLHSSTSILFIRRRIYALKLMKGATTKDASEICESGENETNDDKPLHVPWTMTQSINKCHVQPIHHDISNAVSNQSRNHSRRIFLTLFCRHRHRQEITLPSPPPSPSLFISFALLPSSDLLRAFCFPQRARHQKFPKELTCPKLMWGRNGVIGVGIAMTNPKQEENEKMQTFDFAVDFFFTPSCACSCSFRFLFSSRVVFFFGMFRSRVCIDCCVCDLLSHLLKTILAQPLYVSMQLMPKEYTKNGTIKVR